MTAGAHSIVVKHSQGTGGGYATLSYNGGAGSDAPTTALVPASAFTTGSLASTALGPLTSSGGTIDISNPSTTSSITLQGGTLAFTSATIDNLTAAGITIQSFGSGLAPTSAGLIVAGVISETSAGLGLTVAGPYFTEFRGANTYVGTTTVTGGQLRLNTAGVSIAGDLVINAPNATGAIANVKLLQSDQIADTSSVTLNSGILDLGANNDTINNLTVTGGTIMSSGGTLTVNNAPTLTSGTISAGLGGNYELDKNGTGTVVLSGNNTYTGQTLVNGGILVAQGTNSLGAGGSGNETGVFNGASLRTIGANVGAEEVFIAGTGIAGDSTDGALRNLGGVSVIHNLSTLDLATLRVDSGEVIITGALDVSSGALTKTGNGTLTFATNQASIPAVTLAGGALGFSGPQSFGAATVPVGLAYQFDSDPGAGVTLNAAAGSRVIGNFGVNQTFLGRFTAGSAGLLTLTADDANNLDFTGVPNLVLGAGRTTPFANNIAVKEKGVQITGSITPGATGYRFGGGSTVLNVFSLLSGNNAVQLSGDVQLNNSNTFTGAITAGAGSRLSFVNNTGLGNVANVLTLDNGGILQINNVGDQTAGTDSWGELGNPAQGGRIVLIGAGGGTIDIPARQAQGNFGVITTTNGLTGSGPLTKTGLGFLEVLTSNDYSGNLTIAVNGNRVDLRTAGALPNVNSVTINNSGRLDIDNNGTLGPVREFPFVDNRNRINNAAPIALNGGTLRFVSRNVAFAAGAPATSEEDFGAVTLGVGQSFINSSRSGGGGSDMVIANLIRNVGSGTVNFTTDLNTLGQFADNPRIILTKINAANPTVNSFIAGWATINQSDFAAYGGNSTVGGSTGTATGVVNYGSVGAPSYTALTAAATPGAGGFVTGSVGNAAASLALGTAGGAGQNFVVRALRFGAAAVAETISFADNTGTPDTLYVESGGIITDNGAAARALGGNTDAFARGRLTAGQTTATSAQELFFHNNTAATLTINSQIIDNPNNVAATVKVVKAQDGTVVLDGANLYTGGTLVERGTFTVNSTDGLGTGAVVVSNAQLNLGNKGATSSSLGVTVQDQGTVVLTNNTAGTAGAYDANGDRYTIGTGSTIYANSPGAGFGFNSLTRVSAITGPGQVVLAPGAIVKHNLTNAANQGAGALTINNLGTAADLFFAPGTGGGVVAFNNTVTLGAGTPWAGMSSDRGGVTWAGGTIFANSDFILQGLTSNGTLSTLTLGANTTAANNQGGLQIVNNTGGEIFATVLGAVAISEDEPVQLPSNLTFVLSPGSIFQPNTSMAMGFGASQAKILVRAGATLDPGNYTALGATANTNKNIDGSIINTQNLPYALPSPVNGLTTVEAGGRFLINDASGIGSAPVGSYTFKADSILQLGSANAFFGRGTYGLTQTGAVDTTGLALPGQFVYEPGAIVRLGADNVYKFTQFTPANAVYEVYDANRNVGNQTNPFIIPVPGTPTIAPENLVLNSGGILTNDSIDRQLNQNRGVVNLGTGAVLAATTGTYFSIQDNLVVDAGVNVTIGSTKYLDGMPKLGAVQLNGPNSNIIGAGASFTVLDGAQLSFAAANVFPNTTPISLPAAVAAFPGVGGSASQPSTGSTLLLNTANFIEYVGHVTGNGTVMANAAGAVLAINTTSDFTSNVVFKSTNGQNPSLLKAGPNKLTLTGNSDSSGLLVAQQGEVVITGGTTLNWDEIRPQLGAKITVDSSGASPINNRLGTPSFLVGQGGTFELIGNATTPVTETFTNIATGAGGFGGVAQNGGLSFINVTPGAATTVLAVGALENFQTAGQRVVTSVLRTPSVTNLPGTYTTAGVYTPNGGNSTNGLVQVTTPNFGNQGAFGVGPGGNIVAEGGTPVVATRGDYLGDSNTLSGIGTGFMTEDTTATGMRLLAASEYIGSFRDNQTTSLNVKLSGTTSISGDTRVQTLTLNPGSTLNIAGNLPLNASASRLVLNAAGVFVQAGAASTINGTANTFLQTNGGTSLYLHTQGDLNLNATAFSDTGIVKTGAGTLNVGTGAFNVFRGSLLIDGGVVNLAANNTFANIRGQNGFTSNNNLYLNAGTLNLNGNSEIINLLNSEQELPGQAGNVSSVGASTLTILGGGRFAGTIGGDISIYKPANNTLLLTNNQTYNGATKVSAGTLWLRDSATLANTSSVDVNYATLLLDNAYLSNVTNRIPAATPVTLRGATVNLNGAAGQVTSQTFNTLTLIEGTNTLQSSAGGGGANVYNIGNLVRAGGANGGAFLNFQQNFGVIGTAGNNTTAIREFITNINGVAPVLNDGILPAWMIVNGNDFATYQATTGIGALGNTADGYANYGSTDATTATATQNVNDGAARTFATTKTINAWRIAPNAAVTMTFNAGIGLTLDTGGLITNNNNTTTFTGASATSFLTSNSGELDVFINQNTTTFNVKVQGAIDLVKSGVGTLVLGTRNSYSGNTIVNGGALTLSVVGADGDVITAVPGKLIIQAATVTETTGNQVSQLSDVVIGGGGRFNLANAAAQIENFRSLTFLDGASGTGTANGFDRTALQATSTVNLTGANAITSTNTNPLTGVPFIGGFAGIVGFTNPTGSTINLTSPTPAAGNAPTVGLRIGAMIGQVPTGIAEGGLIKSGNGLLTIDEDQNPSLGAAGITTANSNVITGLTGLGTLTPGQMIFGSVAGIPANSYVVSNTATTITINQNATAATTANAITAGLMNQFGSPVALTDVFNIQGGIVRVDRAGGLGTNFANTTVQSGAVLLGANTGSQVILGSVTLKNGATIGATINSFILGAATLNAANQSTLNLPSGAVNIAAYDYYVPGTNNGNITINSRLIGSGNMNITGPQITQGAGGGGVITFGNPLLSGAGAGQTNYSGTISIGTNAVVANQVALITGSGITRTTGDALGTATINLNGGRLRLRDDLSTTADVSGATLSYGNNVVLSANSYLDANRQTSTTAANNIINLGSLTVGAGTNVLNVDSGNGYQVGFSTLTGAGTLIKGGAGRLNINAIGGGFTGGFGLAGPQGLVIAPAFNTTTTQNLVLPSGTSVPSFALGGFFITEASKSLNVTGTFSVASNAGDIATNKSNVSARLAVTNTSTLTTGTFQNDGLVGGVGGGALITASAGFTGSGQFDTQASGLTLAGNLTSGAPKFTGDNTVTVTGTTHTPTSIMVQSGTLKFQPAAAATTSGAISVLSSPASVAGPTTAPIAAVSSTLELAGGANTIKHTGNITNSGTVRVSSGIASVTGSIGGTTAQYAPGLLEGYTTVPGAVLDVSGTRAANPGNFGIQLEPRMLQTNAVTQQALTGHTDNDTWVYTGFVKDNDGVFSFAENIDDRAAVWIDGNLVLNAANGGASRVVSTAFSVGQQGIAAAVAGSNLGTPSQNFGAGISLPGFGSGWHTIEIRMNNGAGGAGPITGNGFGVNYGFGYKDGIAALDGADMIKPIDDGTGNLFVTAINTKGNILIDSGATLNAGSITNTALVTVGTGGTPAFLNLASSSDMDSLVIGDGSVVTLGVPVPAAAFDAGAAGGNLAAASIQGVPEPGTATLVFGGLLTMLGIRRRRQA